MGNIKSAEFQIHGDNIDELIQNFHTYGQILKQHLDLNEATYPSKIIQQNITSDMGEKETGRNGYNV